MTRSLARVPQAVALAGIWISTVLTIGCGGSGGGPGAAAALAPATTASLGPLYRDTRALPGAAEGAAVALAGGQALVSGGAGSLAPATSRTSAVELQTGQTRALPEGLVVPRRDHALHRSPAGEWFALGGRDLQGAPLASIERFDPIRGAWEPYPVALPFAGPVRTARTDSYLVVSAAGVPTISALDPSTLVELGGLDLPGAPGEAPPLLHLAGRNEALFVGGEFPLFFDLSTLDGYRFPGSWIPQGGSVLPVGDVGVLFVGGVDERGAPLRRAHYLEIATREPVPVGPELPPALAPGVAWLADGTVLMAGGSWDGQPLARVLRFDLSGAAQELSPLGEARSGIGVVSDGARVALIGGRGPAGPSALVDLVGFSALAPTEAFREAALQRERRLADLRSLAALAAQRAATQAESRDLDRQAVVAQGELDQALATQAALQDQVARAQAERARQDALAAAARGEVAALTQTLARLDAAAQQDQARLARLQQERASQLQQAQAADQSAQQQAARQSALQGQLGQVQGQVSALQGQVQDLTRQTAQRAAAQPAPSYGAVLALPGSAPPAGLSTGSRGNLSPTPAPAPAQRPGNASLAPTPNAQRFVTGGVYSWESVLARLNGAAQ